MERVSEREREKETQAARQQTDIQTDRDKSNGALKWSDAGTKM